MHATLRSESARPARPGTALQPLRRRSPGTCSRSASRGQSSKVTAAPLLENVTPRAIRARRQAVGLDQVDRAEVGAGVRVEQAQLIPVHDERRRVRRQASTRSRRRARRRRSASRSIARLRRFGPTTTTGRSRRRSDLRRRRRPPSRAGDVDVSTVRRAPISHPAVNRRGGEDEGSDRDDDRRPARWPGRAAGTSP